MDTFLTEEVNKDYLICWCLLRLLRYEKKSFIWQNVNSNFFKVLFAQILTTFNFIGLSRILIKSFESFSK